MTWTNWANGEPNNKNGGTGCSYYTFGSGKNYKIPCDITWACPVCQVKELNKFKIRGICEHTGIDQFYTSQSDNTLIGLMQS